MPKNMPTAKGQCWHAPCDEPGHKIWANLKPNGQLDFALFAFGNLPVVIAQMCSMFPLKCGLGLRHKLAAAFWGIFALGYDHESNGQKFMSGAFWLFIFLGKSKIYMRIENTETVVLHGNRNFTDVELENTKQGIIKWTFRFYNILYAPLCWITKNPA